MLNWHVKQDVTHVSQHVAVMKGRSRTYPFLRSERATWLHQPQGRQVGGNLSPAPNPKDKYHPESPLTSEPSQCLDYG